MAYLIGALVLPAFSIGNLVVRFELVYCLWLVLVLFFHRAVRASPLGWHSVLSRYGLFVACVAAATLAVYSTTPNLITNKWYDQLMSLYGLVRPLLLLVLFVNVPIDQRFVRRVLWAFLLLSIPLAALSIGQTLGLAIANRITISGFTSPWRTPVAVMMEQLGAIVRSTGVFESPVSNALFFLLVLIVAGHMLMRGRQKPLFQWFLYLSIGLALMGGITTLSSTFLLGLGVCVGLFVLFVWPRYKRRFLRKAAGVAGVVGLTGIFIVFWLSRSHLFSGTLQYQIGRILFGAVLQTRYESQSGWLVGTIKAIGQRPILGWGLAQIEGAFVGDSLYVSILYRCGIVGLLVFSWMLWTVLRHTWRTRGAGGSPNDPSQITFLFTWLLLAVGVGSVSFFVLRIQEWYWALLGMSLNRRLIQSCQEVREPS
jgi:hypothetical protein